MLRLHAMSTHIVSNLGGEDCMRQKSNSPLPLSLVIGAGVMIVVILIIFGWRMLAPQPEAGAGLNDQQRVEGIKNAREKMAPSGLLHRNTTP